MATTLKEIAQRNTEINKAFGEIYAYLMTNYGTASYQAIYFALARRFSLSEMQIRRIVKGYNRKPAS